MKRLMLTIIILLSITVVYSQQEETIEEMFNTNCQWVLIALEGNNLKLAKTQYYSVCNDPTYRSRQGYTWISYAVWNESVDQVNWALSLPHVNINDKFGGQTLLYKTVLNMYHNNIQDESHPRYQILKILLKHGADPLYHNDTEGSPPYSNGESTYELILRCNMYNTSYGKLVLQYIKKE